jgi:hypothetical protein
MALTVDAIVAKFPIKSIPTITGEPDYDAINQMVQTLYGNASLLATTFGAGAYGHIGNIMTSPLYATLTATPYKLPIDPGPLPIIPTGATKTVREQICAEHQENRRVFDNHHNMDGALKTQVIDTIQATYLSEMRNKYTGYLGVTTRDLLGHLLDRYGKITPADIEDCKSRMNEPIDSTQPIDIYFQQVDECIQYAADGRVAFLAEQILQTTYHAVSTSGYYTDACKEWHKKAAVDKTWATFKSFFAAEYHDMKEQQKVNHSRNNFHGANAVTDISTALDNLALTATTNCDIVSQLTKSNKQLTKTNKLLIKQLRTSIEANNVLIKKLGGKKQSPAPALAPSGG